MGDDVVVVLREVGACQNPVVPRPRHHHVPQRAWQTTLSRGLCRIRSDRRDRPEFLYEHVRVAVWRRALSLGCATRAGPILIDNVSLHFKCAALGQVRDDAELTDQQEVVVLGMLPSDNTQTLGGLADVLAVGHGDLVSWRLPRLTSTVLRKSRTHRSLDRSSTRRSR